jgi:hypothetical protein
LFPFIFIILTPCPDPARHFIGKKRRARAAPCGGHTSIKAAKRPAQFPAPGLLTGAALIFLLHGR